MRLRPITSYVGGKSRFAKKIISKFPEEYNTYHEPFIGMGAVFLELQPSKAIISDIDPDIVNIWQQVKDNPKRIISHFNKFPQITDKVFLYLKEWLFKNQKVFNIKKASYYLMVMAYSFGGHILKRKDGYNTNSFWTTNKTDPRLNRFCGKTKQNNLLNISKYLNDNDIVIKLQSYNSIKIKPNDLVYLDPPYLNDDIHQKGFYAENNYIDILHFFKKMKKGHVFLSNSDLILKRYPEFKKYKKVTFKKKSFFKKKKIQYEVLIYK